MERDCIENLDEESEEIEVGNLFDKDNNNNGKLVDTDDNVFQLRNIVDV